MFLLKTNGLIYWRWKVSLVAMENGRIHGWTFTRLSPAILKLRNMIENGELGKITILLNRLNLEKHALRKMHCGVLHLTMLL